MQVSIKLRKKRVINIKVSLAINTSSGQSIACVLLSPAKLG